MVARYQQRQRLHLRKTRNQRETHVDHPRRVSFLQVEQHRGFVKVRHHHHVLNLIKLWGVHGKHLVVPDG